MSAPTAKEIREAFQDYRSEWRETYDEGQTDIRFISGNPWDPADRDKRRETGRPCLSMDEINQYLNQYRIAEAARRLQDPAEINLPISTIALDVGYASLSSFNKAFKEVHGVTPSIYRSRAPQ